MVKIKQEVAKFFCRQGACIVRADYPEKHRCDNYNSVAGARARYCGHCSFSEPIPAGGLSERQKSIIEEHRNRGQSA